MPLCGADSVWRVFANPRDTPEDLELKSTAAPVFLFMLFVTIACTLLWLPPDRVGDVGALAGVCTSSLILVTHRFCSIPVKLTLRVGLVGAVLCCILVDWDAALAGTPRVWAVCVLAMDLGLVYGLRGSVYGVICGMLSLWLALDASEYVARWGLYDAGRFSTEEGSVVHICNCGDPPCARPVTSGVLFLLSSVSVFLIDFHLTRGFAESMRHQLAITNSVIKLSQQLTACLAQYDVDEAEELVAGERCDELPEQMRGAFKKLVSNLKAYRPFLPDNVLTVDRVNASVDAPVSVLAVEPPGCLADEAEVCVCFTDVQSSTVLWEFAQQGMFSALQIHNTVLRQLAVECSGYEVKTIGDAFMLAFEKVVDCCRFGLESQLRLVQQAWPNELCANELCKRVAGPTKNVLWHGLRVRIGMHWGPVHAVSNPITGRMDYFGPPVNTAARVESSLQYGGLTGVTEAVLDELTPDGLRSLDSPMKHYLGKRELRGVADPVAIFVLLPAGLAERVSQLFDGGGSDVGGSRVPSEADCDSLSHSVLSLPPLRQPLRTSTGTCAVARMRSAWWAERHHVEDCRMLLSAIEQAADLTQGTVAALLSLTCHVTWNAGQACYNHVQQCALFTSRLQRAAHPLALGLATADMVSGNVAARRRKYATVFSAAVELGVELAELAEQTEIPAYAAGAVASHLASTGCASRAHVWTSLVTDHAFIVWRVCCRTPDLLQTAAEKWDALGVDRDLIRRQGALDASFLSLATGGAAIVEAGEWAGGDQDMERMLQDWQSGAVLTRTTVVEWTSESAVLEQTLRSPLRDS
eukprot:TRINITY_DN9663_c1_g1_i1.p1 TRINITY_DN9663_c1_g1~~TRINITY_DN9663_c1_g1_i1.p1  ORF type:complete len:809 (+),score=186.51 TRINITY_DN9663_c1_g1_i1:66-2492(+)